MFDAFPVEIWGTVADWGAVLVYSITGWFIYSTFRSQLQVQRLQQRSIDLQNRLTQIEISRYRYSIMPKISIQKPSYDEKISHDKVFIDNLEIGFRVLSNPIKDIRFNITLSNGIELLNEHSPNNLEFINSDNFFLITGDIKIEPVVMPGHIFNYNETIKFDFIFNDIDGNNYSQICFLILRSGQDSAYSENPVFNLPTTPAV